MYSFVTIANIMLCDYRSNYSQNKKKSLAVSFKTVFTPFFVTILQERKFNFEKGMDLEKSANKVEKEREHKILYGTSHDEEYIVLICIVCCVC